MSQVRSRRRAFVVLGVGLFLLVLGSWSGAQYRRATLFSPFFYAPSGLAISPNREIVVGVEASRIHIYDDEGRFIRGWGLSPYGGPIRLQLLGSEAVEVARRDRDHLAVYGLDGQLLSSRDQPGAFDAIAVEHDIRVMAPGGDMFELGPEGLVRSSGGTTKLIVPTPLWPLQAFGADPVVPVALLMAGGAVATMIGVVMTADSSRKG